MSDQTNNRSRAPAFIAATLTVLTIYVLSIGPGEALVKYGYISSDALRWFYLPLAILFVLIPPLRSAYEWYVDSGYDPALPPPHAADPAGDTAAAAVIRLDEV